MSDPLPIPDEHWRSRWLVFPDSWNRLHRVAALVAAVHRASKQDEWREAELRRKRTDDLH